VVALLQHKSQLTLSIGTNAGGQAEAGKPSRERCLLGAE
jgi:hypothetical protein